MDLEFFYNHCQAKKAVTAHFPFDEDTLVFKVGAKMFALTSLKQWENMTPSVNLKCDPEMAELLRSTYDAVKEGYHMSKVHWNTIAINQDVPDALLLTFIENSYQLVFKSLTKSLQAQITSLE